MKLYDEPAEVESWAERGPRWLFAVPLGLVALLLVVLAGLLELGWLVAAALVYIAASIFILNARGNFATAASFIVAVLLLIPVVSLFTMKFPLK